ncbi:MAG: hypothetical protein M1486_00820 [Gammaproteobacteria bacterium]|nr:hypothetical protein [Gammaproteobacteria bacterium]
MKMDLSLDATYEQMYDIAYQGYVYPKEVFRCVCINDKKIIIDEEYDAYEQCSHHLTRKIIPALKPLMGAKYLIHDIDGEQGQIHPHLILRRTDFNPLTTTDCANIETVLNEAIQKINSAPEKRVTFGEVRSIFLKIPPEFLMPRKQVDKEPPVSSTL